MPSFKIDTWTGKRENTVLDPECRKYIKGEMKKSVDHYRGTVGFTVSSRQEAAFSMDFRINKLRWSENRGRLTILQVQPEIYSLVRVKARG
jgi:hypothetical protein